MKRLFIVLLLVATALAASTIEPVNDGDSVPLVKPLPPPQPAPARAAAPAAVTAAATPAKAPAPAPQPKAAAAAAASPPPPAFTAYTLSAAQATLSPDPATEGLATLILKGLSNTTIPRGSAGVLNGPMHTPTFLATSFPAESTVELRGSAAAAGGGDWGSCYLRKVSLVASGAADGVAVLSGVVVPVSLGDAGQATFGSQRGTLVFNRVRALVTPPRRRFEGGGGGGAAAARKLVAPPSPAAPVAAAAAAAAKAPSPAAAKNATAAASTSPTPKVSVAAATRPVASVKSVPMPREFSN